MKSPSQDITLTTASLTQLQFERMRQEADNNVKSLFTSLDALNATPGMAFDFNALNSTRQQTRSSLGKIIEEALKIIEEDDDDDDYKFDGSLFCGSMMGRGASQ
jgi:hypothetical protein